MKYQQKIIGTMFVFGVVLLFCAVFSGLYSTAATTTANVDSALVSLVGAIPGIFTNDPASSDVMALTTIKTVSQ